MEKLEKIYAELDAMNQVLADQMGTERVPAYRDIPGFKAIWQAEYDEFTKVYKGDVTPDPF